MEEVINIIRAISFMLGCSAFTWVTTQGFKTLLKSIIANKILWRTFLSDGDFPSAHSATSTTQTCIIIFILFYTIVQAPDYLLYMIVSVIIYSRVIDWFMTLRDSCGHRLKADETRDCVKNMSYASSSLTELVINGFKTNDTLPDGENIETITEKIQDIFSGIANKEFKKVGHFLYEVLGGVLSGILGAIWPISIIFGYSWAIVASIIGTILYTISMIFVVTYKKKGKLK